MTHRKVLVALLAVCLAGLFALPAAAHHTEQNHGDSCMAAPPAYGTGDTEVSGWSVYATGDTKGVRSNDVYVFATASAENGATVYVFQPYWDNQSPPLYPGPHWIDASITVGPAGPGVCDRSHINGA